MSTVYDYVVNQIASSTPSDSLRVKGNTLHLSLDFSTGTFVGSATLQVSKDGGATFQNVTDAQGNAATWSSGPLETPWPNVVKGFLYRWDVARTSGTLYAGLYDGGAAR